MQKKIKKKAVKKKSTAKVASKKAKKKTAKKKKNIHSETDKLVYAKYKGRYSKKAKRNQAYNHNPSGKGGFADHPELRNTRGPRKEYSITTSLMKMLEEENTEDVHVDELTGAFMYKGRKLSNQNLRRLKLTNREILVKAWFRSAQGGNAAMLREILDRTDGPVKQKLEITKNPYRQLSDDELNQRVRDRQARHKRT